MKKKIADIIVILFIILNLTGCYNYREINKMTFVTSVIFAKGERDSVSVYLDCVRPYRSANESSDKGRRVIFKGNGKTALEAIRNINVSSNYNLNFSQVRAYIFSEGVAKEGVQNYIDLINNDQQFSYKPYMFVYEGDVKKLIETTNEDEEYLGLYLDELIQKNDKNGKVVRSNVNDYIKNSRIGSRNSFMSDIELVSDDIESKIQLNGGSVFHDNKIVEKLKPEDVLTYNILMKTVREGTFEVPNPNDKEKFITLDLLNETNDTSLAVDEDNIILTKNITITVILGEIQGVLEVDDMVLNEIKANEEAKLEKYQQDFFKNYKEKGIDILGIDRLLEEEYPEIDRENFLDKTSLVTNVELIIDGSSHIRNSL
ncbi:germination protein, Ger(x)C family [Clostridium sp. DSM 8431]|uniref:Ger(x)C family spore germination protein n=1 Tax=Clostridium sp. DSM 8431 TaxID=1761781 RepID=UPI0008F1EC54|nr:Ger(x)C family spore germination protein [Clostridium sp. DSM 8431]SFU65261.1 germination protein, Ger(x)C family [Clostridium sp. DSM 8431]